MINKFIFLNGAKYFSSGIFQNYLVFIPAKKYIKYFTGATQINSRKSNGMSEENMENTTKSESLFAPTFVDHHVLPDINFNGHCLINNNIHIPKNLINICISYLLNQWPRDLNVDFKSGNFSFTDGSMGKNVIIFAADMAYLCIFIITIKISFNSS